MASSLLTKNLRSRNNSTDSANIEGNLGISIEHFVIRTLISWLILVLAVYHQPLFATLPTIIEGYHTTGNEAAFSQKPSHKTNQTELESRMAYLENAIESLSPLVDQVQALSQQLQGVQEALEKQSTLPAQQAAPTRQKPVKKTATQPIRAQKTIPKKRLPEKTNPESQAAWKIAMDALRKKNYTVATKTFEKFLKDYPKDPNQGSAQYFLGQLSLLQGHPDQALRYFKRFMSQKSQDPRIPDAQFQIGLAHYAKGETKTAITLFRELQQQYPASQAAQTARQQLQRLKAD